MEQTVLDWLIERFPTAKRQTLKRMVQAGRVTINGRPVRAMKEAVAPADKVHVDERPVEHAPGAPHLLRVVHEDTDILVVDKPAGLLTSTVPREPRPTLWAAVWKYVKDRDANARPGLIHRLDRDASGLLVFSKTDAAYQSLKTQFFKHSVHREYTAVVHGPAGETRGRIETKLVERADGTVRSTRKPRKGETAITHYEVLKSDGKLSLLRVVLETGRKHQIRVHLRERRTPIVGDTVYGKKDGIARLHLAATKLVLRHPRDGREITFTIGIPKDFVAVEATKTAAVIPDAKTGAALPAK